MPYQFVLCDVFTRTAFGGNQLAVFPDARGLSDRAMQAMARELNFSESTFLFPPADAAHTRRVRIFTPRSELPFAGHPTVGTAAVLAARGLTKLQDGKGTVVLEEGVGPISVDVEARGDALTGRFTLQRGVERPAERPSVAAAAAVLSLPVEAVVDSWFASAGLRFCFIRLTNREAVDHALLNRAAWAAHFATAYAKDLFLFTGGSAPASRIYARMFGVSVGVDEDPATGSASAALAGSLADALTDPDGTFSWQIDQGVAMGRPSLIEISADKQNGRTVRIRVGGSTVVTGEGSLSVPAGL